MQIEYQAGCIRESDRKIFLKTPQDLPRVLAYKFLSCEQNYGCDESEIQFGG